MGLPGNACLRSALKALVLCVAGAGPAVAAQRYDGTAYDRAGAIAYRETHWRLAEGDQQQRLVLYRCPDGRPFARKQMRWQDSNEAAPDFDFLDQRDGYREGLVSRGLVREVYWQGGASSPERRGPVNLGADAVVDAGFDSFVRRHWDELLAGRPVQAAFLMPSDLAAIPLVIRLAKGDAVDPAAVSFTIQLDAWYAFAAPTLKLTYDRADRWLREFRGTATIRDGRGRRQAVRVEFPLQHPTAVSADAVALAAAEPLTADCQEAMTP